jgi:hypothetical protein
MGLWELMVLLGGMAKVGRLVVLRIGLLSHWRHY